MIQIQVLQHVVGNTQRTMMGVLKRYQIVKVFVVTVVSLISLAYQMILTEVVNVKS
jgi:hypothetical protein